MRSVLLILLTLILCSPGTVSAQKGKKITIAGKVVDAANKPVSGASIFIDKAKTDVVTGQDGSYKIKVKPDAEDILVFSLLSGASEEKINGRTEINFILKDQSVTGNAGKNIPAKSGVVNIKDSAVPVYQDIYDMIRGRVAGVEVSGKSIKIRGTNSLNISTEPLFVVDGVIVKEIDDIAPETVKSIEVLKGPDASVYGTRGSNGVIVITRKTGKD
ncbi:MAG: TonB-dependent receptor plug domain-containing protein [Bacteroidia bacterium]|jgi:TonB-dependent SusC/RagA subfamily outer membrane receptor|nr:TonB-dependent receptor plug domain-containing protein [Bacteroidia bacterium]